MFELPIYQSIKAYVHIEALSAIGLVFSCSVVHGYLLFSLLDFSCSDLLIAQISHFPGQFCFCKLLLFLGPLSAVQFLFRILKKCKMMMMRLSNFITKKVKQGVEMEKRKPMASGLFNMLPYLNNLQPKIKPIIQLQIASWRSVVTTGTKRCQFY